jgi:SPP1 gp7 family putative phage head morphogenesis protein
LEAEAKAADDDLARWEERVRKRVVAALATEQRFVLNQLEAILPNAALVLPQDDWQELLESTGETIASEFGARAAQRFLGLEVPEGFRNLAVEWAKGNAVSKAKSITETTATVLRDVVAEGIAGGDSNDAIAKAIRQRYDQWSGKGDSPVDRSRAMVIARTETGSAANWGAYNGGLATAEAAGLEIQKVWIATSDQRTRDSHAEVNGERVAKDEAFGNGLLYPHDPNGDAGEVINCRCTIGWEVVE